MLWWVGIGGRLGFVVFNGEVLFLVSGFVGFSLGFCCAFRWYFNWCGLDLCAELIVSFVNLIFEWIYVDGCEF